MGDNSCVVCGHREAADSFVCPLDQQRLSDQLDGLGGKVRRLAVELVPAAAFPVGDRVNHTRVHPPTPAHTDVLSLLGPGSDQLSTLSAVAMAGGLAPWVRRWRTVETVDVTGMGGETSQREIVTWHQEIARDAMVAYSNSRCTDPPQTRPAEPDMIPLGHDDQVGLVPPAAWAHSWVRRWQNALGQQPQPARTTPGWGKPTHKPRQPVQTEGRVEGRAGDLLEARWRQRFGEPTAGFCLTQDLGFLRRWLGSACAHDLGITFFAAELRALTEELTRVLGDRPDQHWLGRCPTTLTNRTTGDTRVCGAGIWQDPYASQVTCLRCRTVWGPAKTDLIHLAVAIRNTWPVDRRRRYTATELRGLPPLRCPTCTTTVQVRWKEVTGQQETTRSWQPVAAVCPAGCDTTRLL
jgi:hypothetical protein